MRLCEPAVITNRRRVYVCAVTAAGREGACAARAYVRACIRQDRARNLWRRRPSARLLPRVCVSDRLDLIRHFGRYTSYIHNDFSLRDFSILPGSDIYRTRFPVAYRSGSQSVDIE